MTRLLYVVPWLAVRAVVAAVEWLRGFRTLRVEVPRDRRWDSTEAEVDELPALLREAVPFEAAPVVEEPQGTSWDEKAAAFAALIDDLRADIEAREAERRRRALETPTAAYKLYVREEFGVAVTEVGPREISGVRHVGWTTAEQAVAHG